MRVYFECPLCADRWFLLSRTADPEALKPVGMYGSDCPRCGSHTYASSTAPVHAEPYWLTAIAIVIVLAILVGTLVLRG
jgi:hypothetical protein